MGLPSVSVKSDTVRKTNVFIQEMFTCTSLKFQWQRRYQWGFPNCITLRIVHLPILPFNSYQDLLSPYHIPFIIWYNNKWNSFEYNRNYSIWLFKSRTANCKIKKEKKKEYTYAAARNRLNSFIFAVSVIDHLN